MTGSVREDWDTAVRVTLPVAMGYVPIGMALGALVVKSGLPWQFAPLSAAVVFAGSMEFLLVGLVLAKAALVEIALAALLVNFRHVFYPLSYPAHLVRGFWKRFYLAYTLTDEAYAVMNGGYRPARGRAVLMVQFLGHAYWSGGAALGALLGHALPDSFHGLDFAITGLFVVLTVDFFWTNKMPRVIGYALTGIGAGMLAGSAFLLVALPVFVALCVVEVAWLHRREKTGATS